MSLLTKPWTLALVVVLALIVAGCSQRSPEYDQIHELPYDQWNDYAKSLPLEKRFRLHHEIADTDGPNPPATIDESFYEQPKDAYRYMVNQVKAGQQHPEFLGIIFAIQRNPEFDLCNMPDRAVIQEFLETTKGFTVREQDRPNFYHC